MEEGRGRREEEEGSWRAVRNARMTVDWRRPHEGMGKDHLGNSSIKVMESGKRRRRREELQTLEEEEDELNKYEDRRKDEQ